MSVAIVLAETRFYERSGRVLFFSVRALDLVNRKSARWAPLLTLLSFLLAIYSIWFA